MARAAISVPSTHQPVRSPHLATAGAFDTLRRQMTSAMRCADSHLLPDECRGRMTRWQQSLGDDPSVAVGGFEVHMDRAGRPSGRVDLAFAPGIRNRTSPADLPRFPGLNRLVVPLIRHAREHGPSAGSDGPLVAGVPVRDVWVEYDVDETDAGSLSTSVQPAWLLGPTRGAGRDPDETARLVRVLLRAADRDASAERINRLARLLKRTLAKLARGGGDPFVDYVGLMAGRPDAPVRINIAGLTAETAIDELGADQTVRPVLDAAKRLAYTFDVYGDEIGARRGVELFTAPIPFGSPSSQKDILDRLSALGMLDVDTADALLRWPGATPVRIPELDALATFFNGYGRHYLLRNVNHVKLVFAPDSPITVKAYLGFCHRWFPGP